jgi:hypothetical protein
VNGGFDEGFRLTRRTLWRAVETPLGSSRNFR